METAHAQHLDDEQQGFLELVIDLSLLESHIERLALDRVLMVRV